MCPIQQTSCHIEAPIDVAGMEQRPRRQAAQLGSPWEPQSEFHEMIAGIVTAHQQAQQRGSLDLIETSVGMFVVSCDDDPGQRIPAMRCILDGTSHRLRDSSSPWNRVSSSGILLSTSRGSTTDLRIP
jgi:hypothetical protein